MMGCARDCCLEHGEEKLGGALDVDGYAAAWKELIASGQGAMFLVETGELIGKGKIVGGIGGATGKVMLTGKLRAMCVFWYMDKEHRAGLTAIRLLDRYERWAREQGCVQVTLPVNKGMSDHTGKIYERRGFAAIETTYRKML